MIFKKLILKNIRSYEDLEIEFPKGSTLLAGNIGSGKTSILLGLQFALFGLQPGQKGTSILRQGEVTAYASLLLDVDGEEITLERTIKKSKNGSITQDSNSLTTLEGKIELSTSEMKDRVIRILNYPKEFIKKSNLLYKFTVYTPQEEMKEIILERPEIRLDTLRHIFGIDRYKRIKDNATILLGKIKESVKIKEVLASELNIIKEKHTEIQEKKIILSREVNNLNIEYKKLFEDKIFQENKLKEVQVTIDKKRDIDSQVSSLNVALLGKKDLEIRMKKEMALMQKQTNETIDFSEEKLVAINDLYEKHKRILEEKNGAYSDINSKISVLNSRKESPINLREKVTSLENCPTCFQGVGEEHKTKISKRTMFEIEEIDRELEQRLFDKENILKDLEKEKKLIRDYESDKNSAMQDKIKFMHLREIKIKIKSDAFILDRVSNEIIEITQKIEELGGESKTLENSGEDFEKIRNEFQKINDLIRIKEIILATKEKELELLRSRLEELSLEISNKEKIKDEINHLRSLQDWISEKFLIMINVTENNVMAKLRSEFSSIFSEWFSMLSTDTLSVRLDENFTPLITNQDYDIEYDFLSGGERTAVALAYRLSLNKVLNSMHSSIKTKDIVILDEPTDGFAAEQIDKMRDIFEELNAEQTILVSHEEKIEGFVDHIIKIKKDGISRIE